MFKTVNIKPNPMRALAEAFSLTRGEGPVIALLALIALVCLLIAGCWEKPQEAAAAPAVSWKTRAEHATVKVEKEYRLSETETMKVVIVPGFPMGERCVIYTNERGNAMQCREITPGQQ
jgi:hypothetical protein